MSEIKKTIMARLDQMGLSIAEFGRRMGMEPRVMQHRMKDGTFNIEELERIEKVLGITIFIDNAKNKSALVNEPGGSYGNQSKTINLTIQIGLGSGRISTALERKLEDLLPEFLEFEREQRHKLDTD